MQNSLYDISKKYGLDKNICTGNHNYIPAYEKLLENRRYEIKNLLEIGIGSVENGQMSGVLQFGYKTGNSLKCWNEYLPNANIYGIDLYAHPELDTDKIKTFVADQSNDKDLEQVVNTIDCKLDVIIDDGSHRGEDQVFSFMYLHKYLSDNGIYIIEDVQTPNIDGFKELSIFPYHFQIYIKENFIVEYFDTRHQIGRADDFIISFTKK